MVASVAALLAVLVFVLQPTEPAYKGKRLGYWPDQLPATLQSANGGTTQMVPMSYNTLMEGQADEARVSQMIRDAKDAVDTLGTNCLRTLVARLGYTDSPAKSFVHKSAVRLGFRDPRRNVSAEVRRGQALTALARIDSRAKMIVPDLLALMKNTDPGVRSAARHALWLAAPGEYRRLEEQGQLTSK